MSFTESLEDIVDNDGSGLLGAHGSWKRVELAAVAPVQNGFAFRSKHFSPDQGVPLIRIRDVSSDHTQVCFTEEFDAKYWVKPGQLIIGMDGDFNCALWSGPRALLNQRVCRLDVRASVYDRKFLFYVLPGYLRAIHAHTSSVTVKHLSSKTIASIPLPLPPLDEQRRIVAEIEKQLSRLDAAVAALERARKTLEHYRGWSLRAALTGRLLDGDPSQWERVVLQDIAEIQGGLAKGKRRRSGTKTRSVPYLRVANVQRGFLNLSDVREIEATDDEIEKLRLVPGDVLFTEGGDRDKLGRGWIWQGELDLCIHQNHIFRARVDPDLADPKFISWFGNTMGRDYFEKQGKQTTNLASISLGKLRQLPIDLPSKEEQERIVAELDNRLAVIDHLDQDIEKGLRRANHLRQSILKRAFEGRLVPQDPNDEPASVLLERIRAERANP